VKAFAIGGLSPTLFPSSQTLDARLRAAITTPPKFRSPDLLVLGNALSFLPISDLVLAHVPIQMFLDFNAIYFLIE
jgi:hypothetical protein